MDQVIKFDKTFQERLVEYENVFASDTPVPITNITKEWSFFLDLELDPKGWQAIWKIQRKTCRALDIQYPTIVLVVVIDVDCSQLMANVKILAVLDDIHLPEEHTVPLIDLWPTIEQDKSMDLNILSIANCLDMLRFFFANLLLPWDYDDEETVDWRSKHLESRLRLYYDVRNGVLSVDVAEHLRSMATEAKHIQMKKEEYELELEKYHDEIPENKTLLVEEITEMYVRMLEIKAEFDIWENPLLRNVLVKQMQQSSSKNSNTKKIWLIFKEGTADEHIDFLHKVCRLHPTAVVQFWPALSKALQVGGKDDVYLLSKSTHELNNNGALKYGCTIKGIADRETTVLTSELENVMFDFRENIVLENLTIDAKIARCAILISRGNVSLVNCLLIGDNKSSTHQGIIVLANGRLELIGCEIRGFSKAIVGNSGSNLKIINSKIHSANIGVKLFENAQISIEDSQIFECKEYGLWVDVETENESRIVNLDQFHSIPQVHVSNVIGSGNGRGDVLINKPSQLKPFDDLFSNPDLQSTFCSHNGISMEVNMLEEEENDENEQNTTIVENGFVGKVDSLEL